MRVYNKQIMTNQPLNVSFNSPFSPLKSIILYTMAFNVTGTPNGTVKLQASNDPETNDTQYSAVTNLPPTQVPVNWADIENSTFVLTASGTTMWNVRDIGYNYVRVVYTDSSGGTSAATVSIVLNCKGI